MPTSPSDLGAVSAVRPEYPHLWEREPRGGYGFIERVPCRRLGTTAKGRMKIAALQASGAEVIRYVDPAKVRDA